MNARRVSLLVTLVAIGVGYFATGVESVRTEPDDNSGLEAIPVESNRDVHRKFLTHQLEEGVSVEAATAVYLARRATRDGGIALSRWRRLEDETSSRFKLAWTEDLAEVDNPNRIEFRFDAEAGELTAESKSARAIVAEAGKLGGEAPWAVHPTSYVPEPEEGEPHWTGRSRKVCASPTFEHNCRTLEAFFQKRSRVREGLGWVMRTLVDEQEQFDRLRREGECTWKIVDGLPNVRQEWATHRITYDCAGQQFQWNFERENTRLSALDPMAHLLAQVQSVDVESEESESPEMVGVELGEIREAVKKAVGNAK